MSRGAGQRTTGVRQAAAATGLVLVSGLSILLTGHAAEAARSAADATGSADIRITVTSLAPTSLAPDGTLVIGGRVVNASDTTLVDLGARLRVGSEAITSRAEMAAFAAGTDAAEVGLVPAASLVDVVPELAPGAAADVHIEVPGDELGLVPGFGVHPLTLELRVAEPDGTRRTAGSVRTFLVTSGLGAAPTVRVAWLWPLVGTPGRGPDGTLPPTTATRLANSLRADGRLGGLLGAGVGHPVTWLVDGALLEDVRSLATGNGLPAGVQPDPVATSWLATLSGERMRPTADVEALPFADPDLVAVERAGLADDLTLARTYGAELVTSLLGGPVGTAPAWPVNGLSNRSTLETLQAQGAGSVILSSVALEDTGLGGTADALTSLTDLPDLSAVTADATLSALVGSGPAKLGGTVLATQRLLAETAMIAAERPSDPRSVVVSPPRRWAASPDWARAVADASAPWLIPVTLQALQSDPGDAPPATTTGYPPEARAAEVSPTQLATVASDRAQLDRFSAAVADPEAFMADFDPALLTAQSTAWRGKGRAAGRAYTATLTAAVNKDVTSVRLLPRGQVTLSSRTGIIPLAVQNTLDQDVHVRVRVVSTPAVRLRSQPTEVITIPAGRTASVDVAAEATADATFPVLAVLLTDEGASLGDPVTFTVRATGYGQVARVVVGGALVLLAVAVALRVARRIRVARAAESGSLDP